MNHLATDHSPHQEGHLEDHLDVHPVVHEATHPATDEVLRPVPGLPEHITLTVRRATVHDAKTVHTMLLELADHEDTPHAVHATVQDWQRMLKDHSVVVLLALRGPEPVGYVSGVRTLNLWIGGERFALDDLYVRPNARDRGVGEQLMVALAIHLGEDQLLITWGVREDNHAGQRFYRRLGATLRTKVVASWQPADYTRYVSCHLVDRYLATRNDPRRHAPPDLRT
jgi:ribosomal protein S18 acetylase RimI-like enzyme